MSILYLKDEFCIENEEMMNFCIENEETMNFVLNIMRIMQ